MGNRIRELRKAKGLTMKQLGEVLDLAESTISQYETGKRQMDNETLLKLGEFFGVTVGYILGAESGTFTIVNNSDILDDVDVAFYGDFKELNEDEKETVRDMVRLMRQRKEKRSQ